MTTPSIVLPPAIIGTPDTIIFLAGPIQGAPDWQSQATAMLHSIDSQVVVACPRKQYEPGEFVYNDQVDWETHFLRRAGKTGVILFWLAKQTVETPGRAYAQTTRFELAEWKMRHEYEGAKVIVGIEEGFGNARYIRRRLSQDAPGIPIIDTLDALCQGAIDLLHNRK